ncbi:hypothetical protein AS850_14135 [Frondihabitans sp. 762G35]|nr:hypothetical protein AS850_14135 [Frondihabitans sp. 762G35]
MENDRLDGSGEYAFVPTHGRSLHDSGRLPVIRRTGGRLQPDPTQRLRAPIAPGRPVQDSSSVSTHSDETLRARSGVGSRPRVLLVGQSWDENSAIGKPRTSAVFAATHIPRAGRAKAAPSRTARAERTKPTATRANPANPTGAAAETRRLYVFDSAYWSRTSAALSTATHDHVGDDEKNRQRNETARPGHQQIDAQCRHDSRAATRASGSQPRNRASERQSTESYRQKERS